MKFYLNNEQTCTRVKLFGEDVRNLFLINGWTECQDTEHADYIIINTCSFLKSKSDFFLSLIRKYQCFSSPWQKVVVIGCLGGTNKSDIEKISKDIIIFKRDLVFIKEYLNLDKIASAKATSVSHELSPFQNLIYQFNNRFLHSKHIDYRLKKDKVCYIQISVGCFGQCTYCCERFITQLKSRPINEILDAVNDGIERGYTLFGLSTDDASAYGKDIGTSLDELLSELINYKEDIYFTIPEFNPQGLTKSVIKFLEDRKFLYITIPIQSGSQDILDKMKRPYQIKDVIKRVGIIKKNNNQIMINTHIIVGFPGESDKDFEATKNLFQSGLFDRVKVFMYSERPGTEAALFFNKVPNEIKEQRRNELLKIIRNNNFKKRSLTNLILNLEQIKE